MCYSDNQQYQVRITLNVRTIDNGRAKEEHQKESCSSSQHRMLQYDVPRSDLPRVIHAALITNIFELAFQDAYVRHLERSLAPPSACLFPASSRKESQFYSTQLPGITLPNYVQRLFKYARSTPTVFVATLVLVERIKRESSFLRLNEYNIHRLLTTGLYISTKLLEDRRYSTKHYAAVGGVPSADELAMLEVTFLEFLDFRVWISEDDFVRTIRCLVNFCNSPNAGCLCTASAASKMEIGERKEEDLEPGSEDQCP